jgi:hypothetical protein
MAWGSFGHCVQHRVKDGGAMGVDAGVWYGSV